MSLPLRCHSDRCLPYISSQRFPFLSVTQDPQHVLGSTQGILHFHQFGFPDRQMVLCGEGQ